MVDCLFCRIVAGEIPADIVYSDERVLAFRDIAPQAPVHILVIPREHRSSLLDRSGEDGLFSALLDVCAKVAIQEGLEEGGFRVVTNIGADGGQSVGHLHFHVLGGRALGVQAGPARGSEPWAGRRAPGERGGNKEVIKK